MKVSKFRLHGHFVSLSRRLCCACYQMSFKNDDAKTGKIKRRRKGRPMSDSLETLPSSYGRVGLEMLPSSYGLECQKAYSAVLSVFFVLGCLAGL